MEEKNKIFPVHITSLLLLSGLLSVGAIFAQDPTASENISVQQSWERYKIERQIKQVTAPEPALKVTSPQLPPPDIGGKSTEKIFKLKNVVFDPPEPKGVSRNELDAIKAKYVAMDSVSIYDLYCMVVEIDNLFDAKSILARAGLPVQDVKNGIVEVQIIEGRKATKTPTTMAPSRLGIGRTFVLSKRLMGQRFIRDQFHFSEESSFNIEELENEMLRYNRIFNSRIETGIEPGDEPGEYKLNLTRKLPQLLSGGYRIDNTGRESSGVIRNGFHFTFSDVLGTDDSFFISYDKTEGTSALYLQGKIPISTFGTFLDMSYYSGEPKTTSGPFAALLINGKSVQYRPGIRQIIFNEKNYRLDFTLNYENYDSQTYFDKALNYAEKHESSTLGFEYSGKSALFAGFSLTMGSADTLTLPYPDYKKNRFKLMKMNAMKVWSGLQAVDDTFILRGNASVSLSDLPPSQSFQIGGMSTVRGAPEAFVSGETGYLIVAEYRVPVWRGTKNYFPNSKAEIFTFFDQGGVFDRKTSNNEFLFSIGIGGTIRIDRYFSLTALYGKPVFKTEASKIYRDQLKSGNASFTLGVSF